MALLLTQQMTVIAHDTDRGTNAKTGDVCAIKFDTMQVKSAKKPNRNRTPHPQ
jgi:hypothetical protein